MNGVWHGGKGSVTRKREISQEEWESRWDMIFSRDLKETVEESKDNNESRDSNTDDRK